MKRFCTVPQGETMDVNGKRHYIHCGEPAKYKVGDWYVCEGHKIHYTDPNEWPAELLKGETDAERDGS
jgi:hypothetical protein